MSAVSQLKSKHIPNIHQVIARLISSDPDNPNVSQCLDSLSDEDEIKNAFVYVLKKRYGEYCSSKHPSQESAHSSSSSLEKVLYFWISFCYSYPLLSIITPFIFHIILVFLLVKPLRVLLRLNPPHLTMTP